MENKGRKIKPLGGAYVRLKGGKVGAELRGKDGSVPLGKAASELPGKKGAPLPRAITVVEVEGNSFLVETKVKVRQLGTKKQKMLDQLKGGKKHGMQQVKSPEAKLPNVFSDLRFTS